MPRRNRVDPWGDLHAVSARGLFTGNRGCIVDEREQVVRHHHSSTLWITCLTEFRDWRVPLARPNRWTPIFFLDDAVALAAGHRPCATCRRDMIARIATPSIQGCVPSSSIGGSRANACGEGAASTAAATARPGEPTSSPCPMAPWSSAQTAKRDSCSATACSRSRSAAGRDPRRGP
jgi:hypothetical protein